MATAVTDYLINLKPPQVENLVQSAVRVGSTGNADEELEVSSMETAERKLIQDPIGNITRDEESADAEDQENSPSGTWHTVTSFFGGFSRIWRRLRGSAKDTMLNCSICNEPLDLKKGQLNNPDAASTIRCQK